MNIKVKIHWCWLPVFLSLFLLEGCNNPSAEQPKEVAITEQETQQGVGLNVGDTLEIVLDANPSTGYAWEPGFYNESVLKPVGEPEFVKQDASLGSGEKQKVHFLAIGPGETKLSLVYRRPFEKATPDSKMFTVDVTVK